jgi:hypothetical protein
VIEAQPWRQRGRKGLDFLPVWAVAIQVRHDSFDGIVEITSGGQVPAAKLGSRLPIHGLK